VTPASPLPHLTNRPQMPAAPGIRAENATVTPPEPTAKTTGSAPAPATRSGPQPALAADADAPASPESSSPAPQARSGKPEASHCEPADDPALVPPPPFPSVNPDQRIAAPQAPSRLSAAYVGGWSALAGFSAVYLAIAAFAPELIGMRDRGGAGTTASVAPETTPGPAGGSSSASQRIAANSPAAGTPQALLDKLDATRERLARLRGAVDAPAGPSAPAVTAAAPSRTVASLPQASPAGAASLPASSPRAAPVRAPAAQPAIPGVIATIPVRGQSISRATPPVTDKTTPEPVRTAAAQANTATTPQQSAPITTGSIASQAVTIPPLPARAPADRPRLKPATTADANGRLDDVRKALAARPPARTGTVPSQSQPAETAPSAPSAPVGGLGVQLANASDADTLRIQWMALKSRFEAQLAGLEARYIQGASELTLVAGPISTAERALDVCTAMDEAGMSCVVGSFAGNRL